MVMSADNGQGVHADSKKENLTNLDRKSMNQNEGVVPVNRKGKNIKVEKGKDGKYCDSHHEMQIWNEREMEKKTMNMFARLHALLPDLPSNVDKSTIVDAAVEQIKNLQQTLENLEKKKQEKLKFIAPLNSYESRETIIVHQGSSSYNNKLSVSATPTSNALSLDAPSQNVVLNISGSEAQFCICATKKPGLLATIAFVLEKHMIDVVSANIMCNENGNVCMILIHASQRSYDTNSMVETYKQAAGEIMTWIS
ncbi:hypothetical protein RYX36_034740 [Vicia faba]